MKRSPAILVSLASVALLGLGTTVLPTAFATSEHPPPAPTARHGEADARPYGQFIVKFTDDVQRSHTESARRATIASLGSEMGVRTAEERVMAIGASVITTDRLLNTREQAEFMSSITRRSDIEWIQPDYRKKVVEQRTSSLLTLPALDARATPNDPRFREQWHYANKPMGIDLPSALDLSQGNGVVVGVVDTGVVPHPDLSPNVIGGYDFISKAETARDGDGRDANYVDEGDWFGPRECGTTDNYGGNSSWHGTHVAGTIAAVTNNGQGVAGVAPGAKIVMVRGLGKCGGDTSDANDGMVWLAGGDVPGVPKNPNPVTLINLSIGDDHPCTPADQAAVTKSLQLGALSIVAAGNSSKDVAKSSPGSCNGALTVGSSDFQGDFSYFSNFGTRIDVSAPGGSGGAKEEKDVLSTVDVGKKGREGAGYGWKAGTSMACPHVAGLAALLSSRFPGITPQQLTDHIKANVKKLPGECPKGCGTGLIDPVKALKTTPSGPAPQPTPAPTPTTTPSPTATRPPFPTPTATRPPAPTPTATRPPFPTPTAPPAPTATRPPAPSPTAPAPNPTRPRPTWPNPFPGQP